MFIKKLIEKLKKSGSTIFILIGIVLILYLYNNYHKQFTRFHYPSKCVRQKTVTEEGKVKFKSGKELNFKNHYTSKESVTKSGTKLTVTGKYKGEIDPKLKPHIKESSYYIEIDTTGSGIDISSKFSALYPVALRRFLYFMPIGNLFDNKKWEIVTKDQAFSCSYQLFLKTQKNYVTLICSGLIGNSSAAMTGQIILNDQLNGFQSTSLDITVEDPGQISSWEFTEISRR